MSVEHEQLCERTIASVVHEIDDLKRQLAEARRKVANVDALHEQYLPAAVEFYCCGHCNAISGGYVAWPCPTIRALENP